MEVTRRRTILTYAAALCSPEILVGAATRTQIGTVPIPQTIKPDRCRAKWLLMSSSITRPAEFQARVRRGRAPPPGSGRQTVPSIVSSKATGSSAKQPS